MINNRVTLNPIQPQIGIHGRLEHAFYPGRNFEGKAHVVLWPKESWFNIQYLKFFRDCDQKNIEVVVHCNRNFLPIASLIGHKAVMQETKNMAKSVFHPNSRISTYGYDVTGEQEAFSIRKWDMGFHKDRENQSRLPTSAEELQQLIQMYSQASISIENEAYEWFQRWRAHLPTDVTMVELKCRWSEKLIEKFRALSVVNVLGADKMLQQQILCEYGCEQFFLTIQLLAGLLNRWSFLALHGAASVFSLLLPVNVLAAMDWDNLSGEMQLMRSSINMHYYGVPTIGSVGLGRDFATRLAESGPFFDATVGAALDNRCRALWPEVEFAERRFVQSATNRGCDNKKLKVADS